MDAARAYRMLDEDREAAMRLAFVRRVEAVKRARRDANAFIEFCAEVEGGKRAKQDAVHREWQRIWSKHSRCVILAPVGHGKSTQIVWRLLWELGRNPNLQIAIISATQGHPKNLLGSIKQEIEENPRIREVFPKLRKSTGSRELWTSTEILVDRTSRDPSPSIRCFGLHGKILGSRATLIILDDICNMENTLSDIQRESATQWVSGEVLSRLKPKARVWAIGHIWHEQDALQELRKKPGWAYYRYEAWVPKGTIEKAANDTAANDDEYPIAAATGRITNPDSLNPEEVEPLAPGVMPPSSLEEKAGELGPVFELMMLWNRLPASSIGRFRSDWFAQCLKLGAGLGFLPQWDSSRGPAYTGVDLGHRKAIGSDLTVLFTVAVLPSGHRQVLDVRSGRWSGPEILDQIRDVHRRFGSIIAVENNAAQNYLLEFAADLDTLPLKPHTTTAPNKYDMAHGIESLGHELRQQRWILPCSDESDPRGPLIPTEEMAAAIKGAMAYDPKGHPADHLMAWWICREAIRLSPAANGIEYPDLELMVR